MATTTQSLTVPAKEKAEHPCPCGCASCEGTCCHLDCLVRPRFFCGQLLTDADLSALLKWARDHFGLSRYRHGWGVVCGLDVRCASDPKHPLSVVVTPGYAVNCCGDDIIVCEEATLDLSEACRRDKDPCADLRREVRDARRKNILGAANVRTAAGEAKRVSLTPEGGTHTHGTGDEEIDEERIRVVDIYLRYAEKPSEPTTALGRSSCKQVSECEYSRTQESYQLKWEFGVVGNDPVRARALRWHEGYENCLKVLTDFRHEFNQNLRGVEVRRWLLNWIDAHPQYQLCYLRDDLCKKDESVFEDQGKLAEILFNLVQNCRNAYLNCDCFGCDEDEGVPLARVWLLADDDSGRDSGRIMGIDPYPPYRRPIQPECWPAPLGYVNVGRFIWHRREEVCTGLNDLGVQLRRIDKLTLTTLEDLEKTLDCDLFVRCDEERIALVYAADVLGERVVGFCPGLVAPPPPPLDMSFTNTASPTEVMPGDAVTYTFVVSNTGAADLHVSISDLKLNINNEDLGILPPGQSKTFTKLVSIPAGTPPGAVPNTATATGTATGGEVIKRTDDSSVTVLEPCPTISLTGPGEVKEGDPLSFTSNVSGGDPRVTPFFNWRLSVGTITSGQGTSSITVDTTGAGGQTLTATVEVQRYASHCSTTRSTSTKILQRPGSVRTEKITEYGDLKAGDEKTFLDLFAKSLSDQPTTDGYIIAYDKTAGPGLKRANIAKDYLVNTRGIGAERLFPRESRIRQEAKTELWLVTQGATPPMTTGLPPSTELRDDMTEIGLIGPARAARLEAAGIKTFADLASTTVERLKEVVPELGEDALTEWIKDAKNRVG